MPSLSRSNPCGSGGSTRKFRAAISLQSRSGGGGAIQISGYERWQFRWAFTGRTMTSSVITNSRNKPDKTFIMHHRGGRCVKGKDYPNIHILPIPSEKLLHSCKLFINPRTPLLRFSPPGRSPLVEWGQPRPPELLNALDFYGSGLNWTFDIFSTMLRNALCEGVSQHI